MISKNDIFSKKEVEESIDNKAPYVGKEEPTTDTVLWIDPTGTPSGGNGGSISLEIDSKMSDESINPVQNKVIKQYVDNAAPRQFGDDFAEDFN